MRTLSLFVCLVLFNALLCDDLQWSANDRNLIGVLTKEVRQGEHGAWLLRTKHYEVTTYADAEFTAKTGAYMERARASIDELLGFKATRKTAIKITPKVIILSSLAEYSKAYGQPSSAGGWFNCPLNADNEFLDFTIYTYRDKDGGTPRFEDFYWPILTHEGTHQLLREYAGSRKIPGLLDEGMATYLQTWNLTKTVEYNMAHRKAVTLSALPNGTFSPGMVVPLTALYDPQPFDVDGFGVLTNARYFMAEMFIEYHLKSNGRKDRLRSMYVDALDGKIDERSVSKYLDSIQASYTQFVLSEWRNRN